MSHKKNWIIIMLLTLSANLLAGAYTFDTASGQSVLVDVESWSGTGSNETILVVDWNRLDNGLETVSESHAFGYRWDGSQTVADMLDVFSNDGTLAITSGYGGAFIYNIGYYDVADDEVHMHIEEGSWNLASTDNAYAQWGTWGNSEWDFNTAGIDAEYLTDGSFEGINAITWFSTLPDYADDQLDIPFVVPEPLTVISLSAGSLLALRRRQR